MLAEWLATLTTPCPGHLRAMGYLRESIGLGARARRCRSAWASHVDASRGLIREAAQHCDDMRRCVVLGSGPLGDVPVDDLVAMFDDVVLVDILHPRRVSRRRWPDNVRLVSTDVSAVVEAVYALVAGHSRDPLPTAPADLPVDGADLVVSVNLLSQLPLLPRLYVAKHQAWRPPDEIEAFAKAIIDAHLAALDGLGAACCLISEVETLYVDAGTVVESVDDLHGVTIDGAASQWTWDFAPKPEVDPHTDVQKRVVGRITGGAASP